MKGRGYYLIRYYYIPFMVISGSGSSIISSCIQVNDVYYPIFQTLLMFLGESLSIIPFILNKKKPKSETVNQAASPVYRSWLIRQGRKGYCVLSLLELFSSILEIIASNFLEPGSIVSLKMLNVIYILYYRIFHINKTVFKHQKLGIGVYLIGMVFLISEIIINRLDSFNATYFIGIGLMVVSVLFNAIMLILEEQLIYRLDSRPSEVNLIKGLVGILLCLITYFPVSLLMASIFNGVDETKPFSAFEYYDIAMFSVALVVCLAFLNYLIVATLKYTEALTVSSIDIARIGIFWGFYIIIDFKSFFFFGLIGGVLIIAGTMVYNEVIVIPWFGLKESANESIEQNYLYRLEKLEKNNLNVTFFLPLSRTN